MRSPDGRRVEDIARKGPGSEINAFQQRVSTTKANRALSSCFRPAKTGIRENRRRRWWIVEMNPATGQYGASRLIDNWALDTTSSSFPRTSVGSYRVRSRWKRRLKTGLVEIKLIQTDDRQTDRRLMTGCVEPWVQIWQLKINWRVRYDV